MFIKEKYQQKAVPAMKAEFGFVNAMRLPRVQKVTLNMGVKEALNDKKVLDNAMKDMMLISGQKPIITRAKKSIAGFKIRDGYPIGCKVTLRSDMMWQFLDKLVNVSIPRIRDFRGLNPAAFDGFGNFSMGVREQIAFPEIDFDQVDKIRGLNIVVTTSAHTNEEALCLLKALGFPFLTKKVEG